MITELIRVGLEDTTLENQKSVLVIDDLDRIDPAHIFRILNVFSAHIDYRNSGNNKFGFDKITLVCDIKNLRSIFKTHYGASTDFSGYIDKFYSKIIYHFDNRKNIERFVQEVLDSISFESKKVKSDYCVSITI